MSENITISEKDMMRIVSILSDVQEIAGDSVRGRLNLVKGFLFGDLTIERKGILYWFKSKNPNSRFCDRCGLLRVSEYAQCRCNGLNHGDSQ